MSPYENAAAKLSPGRKSPIEATELMLEEVPA
jgi:hypothetical protein